MDQLLLDLLVRLEAVGDRDESLYDSVVREKMGLAVFWGFIKPKPGYVLPDDYGMPEAESQDIRDALADYVAAASALAPTLGLTTFHQRLAAFQNDDLRTPGQRNDYEEFVGWSNPDQFDADGNVVRPGSS